MPIDPCLLRACECERLPSPRLGFGKSFCAGECMLAPAALEQFGAAVERLSASPAAAGGACCCGGGWWWVVVAVMGVVRVWCPLATFRGWGLLGMLWGVAGPVVVGLGVDGTR